MSRLSVHFPGRRARLSVLLVLLLALGAAGLVVSELWWRVEWARDTLATIEPRHARLQGLQTVAPKIEEARAAARQSVLGHAYPASLDAERIGADLQQHLRGLADRSGLTVSGSQVLPRKPGNGFEVVPVTMTVEGPLAALRTFLVGLQERTPPVHVENMQIQDARRRGRNSESSDVLNVRIHLEVLRLNP